MSVRAKTGLGDRIEGLTPRLIAVRREVHGHPELGFEEHRTASLVAKELRSLGLGVRTGVGGTGVVADIDGTSAGPTVLLRADMDALPIHEAGDAPYRSRIDGQMHACGHDGHVAMLLAAARLLVEDRALLAGRVRLAFQPAEERPPGGALAMIADGALEGVDAALALHLWAPISVGSVGIRAGTTMAAHDRLDLRLLGRGGHGGMPHDTRDPIVAMAHVITALQTVVSRGLSALESGVVTVGQAAAGRAFNVIADEAVLAGSIRSLGASAREQLHERIGEIVEGTARALGVTATLTLTPFCPSMENHPRLAEIAQEGAASVVGPERVDRAFRTMASEDFAFFQEHVPSCLVFVGAGATDGRAVWPHHHPSFDIDEASLPIGVELLTTLALASLAALSGSAGGRVPGEELRIDH